MCEKGHQKIAEEAARSPRIPSDCTPSDFKHFIWSVIIECITIQLIITLMEMASIGYPKTSSATIS